MIEIISNLDVVLIILLTVLVLMLGTVFFMLTFFIKPVDAFLNELSTLTPTQAKSNLFRLQRYLLIKSLKTMKKYIGISILLFVIVVLALVAIITIDSRQYFKEYFETERQKLNLRSEQSVDSLLNEININKGKLDSVQIMYNNMIITNNEKIKLLEETLSETRKDKNVMSKIVKEYSETKK